MLVPNILLQFPNQELLSSVGTFTSYNIGCCVLKPDVSLPREVPGRVLPSLAGAQVHVLCAQRGILRQMVWPWGTFWTFWQQLCQCWRGRVSRQPI